MVDHVGKQLETAFSNMLTLLFASRLKKSVSLAGAKGAGWWAPASVVQASVHLCAPHGVWHGRQLSAGGGWGGGLEEGEQVTDDWLEEPANRGRLLRHAVHTTREIEAAMAA
ncbi:hypothetical protein HaLaN_31975 [Haematococcus lacustris]|uniref:Uncharacterized protein n=1 Tax=Haematococcus lacustris TaxID=44745 RepID=A0A6A0AII4_HAELA|nr:hypothetical protein HaLaN_31975 [Haematococcus lacustris]